MKQLRIVIADDSAALRDVLKRTLSKVDGFIVVGTAADGVAALDLVRTLNPHLLVLDIVMPGKDGIETLKEIRTEDSSTVIAMYTAETSPAIRESCLEAGADYVLDKSEVNELIRICNKTLLTACTSRLSNET